jgi:acyl-coenzyme A thioesterase 13
MKRAESIPVEEDTFDIAHITGNASDEIKRTAGNPAYFFTYLRSHKVKSPIFGSSILNRLKVTEISINKKQEEESKLEARIVLEIDVTEEMLNGGGSVHGGCFAFLVDLCSSIALLVLTKQTTGKAYPSVSQSLNIVYHSPAALGERLRIVNTTMTLGARAQSARTEIWNATHRRLAVSGTHITMNPSTPKANL